MRRLLYIGACVALFGVLFAGCGRQPLSATDIQEKMRQDFEKLADYSVTARITYYTGEEPEVYEIRHCFKKPNLYRTEVISPESLKGQTVVFDGNKHRLIYPGASDAITLNNPWEDVNPGLLFKVLQRFYEQPLVFSIKQLDSIKCYTLEIPWDESNPMAQRQRLWLSAKTLKPVKLEILQVGGKTLAQVEYLQLEINKGLKAELFNNANLAGNETRGNRLGYKKDAAHKS